MWHPIYSTAFKLEVITQYRWHLYQRTGSNIGYFSLFKSWAKGSFVFWFNFKIWL